MGCGPSKEEEERLRRYNPDVDSSADDQSDAASSDDDSAALVGFRPNAPKRVVARGNALREASKAMRAAVDEVVRKSGLDVPAGTPVKVVGRLLSTPLANEARGRFWSAKAHKWREAIDVAHQPCGRFTYDLCLHGGNNHRREVGYISSIFDAWAYSSSELGWKSSSDSWLALHFLAMQHPGNEFMNGKFRNLRQGNRAMMSKSLNVTSARVKEMKTMPECLCQVTPPSDGNTEKFTHQRWNPGIRRKTMRRYVYQYIHAFYAAVGVAPVTPDRIRATGRVITLAEPKVSATSPRDTVCDFILDEYPPHHLPVKTIAVVYDAEWTKGYPPPREDVLEAITVLHQRLSRMEPSRDGNTRTMVVLINKLLCECGLQPGIFDFPDAASYWTHAEWRAEIEEAMKRCGAYASGGGEPEKPLPEDWLQLQKDSSARRLGFGVSPVTESTPDVIKREHEKREAAKAAEEAAQWQRRPWFDDDLRRSANGTTAPTAPSGVLRPPRSEFESPLEPDINQRNAYFGS